MAVATEPLPDKAVKRNKSISLSLSHEKRIHQRVRYRVDVNHITL